MTSSYRIEAFPMSVQIAERVQATEYFSERRRLGLDKYDEVWDGVTIVMPLADISHQVLASKIAGIIQAIFNFQTPPDIMAGANVSDRVDGWTHNYRCPDVVVAFENSIAVNCDTHWCGGPDFLVEIVSEDDRCRDKLPFYASVNTREVLIVDRDPWQLELYQLKNNEMVEIGRSTIDQPIVLTSSVLPVTFRLVEGAARPQIEMVHLENGQAWQI